MIRGETVKISTHQLWRNRVVFMRLHLGPRGAHPVMLAREDDLRPRPTTITRATMMEVVRR
jgi:hypothetical protein